MSQHVISIREIIVIALTMAERTDFVDRPAPTTLGSCHYLRQGVGRCKCENPMYSSFVPPSELARYVVHAGRGL